MSKNLEIFFEYFLQKKKKFLDADAEMGQIKIIRILFAQMLNVVFVLIAATFVSLVLELISEVLATALWHGKNRIHIRYK